MKLELNEEELKRLLMWYGMVKYPSEKDKEIRLQLKKLVERLEGGKDALHHYFTDYSSKLDTRIINTLYRSGLWHIEDLAGLRESEIIRIEGIGLAALIRVKEVLRKYREGKENA